MLIQPEIGFIMKILFLQHRLIHVPEASVRHDVRVLLYNLRCKG